jgi:hypothetical protein
MHFSQGEARHPPTPRPATPRGAVRQISRGFARLRVAVNAQSMALMSQVLMQGLVL